MAGFEPATRGDILRYRLAFALRHASKVVRGLRQGLSEDERYAVADQVVFSEKLGRIRSILSSLGPDEAFFSIDEFGPVAVKTKPGRMLTAPGKQRVVPQWQKSKSLSRKFLSPRNLL